MSLLDLVTLALAVWGAVISTWLLVMERRKNQRRMLVELSMTIERNMINNAGFLEPGLGSHMAIKIYGGNVGNRAITLAEVGVLVERGRLHRNSPVLFSASASEELAEGQSHEKFFNVTGSIDKARVLADRRGGIRLVGYYHDEVHGFYRSKPVRTNVDDWFGSNMLN